MGRIEWTTLEGEVVEAVVAMFVNRERPSSTRITPSKGDGGVDILDRGGGSDGSDSVYQVKRYTRPLTANQKAEVENSLAVLKSDPRWSRLAVREWRLVLPWDPTPEAEAWLQEVGERYDVSAIWHGLTYVEQLAAKYPDVVDYYLHGGRSRVAEAYEVVAALFSTSSVAAGLSVMESHARVQKALLALDDDPHYMYEHRFGHGEPPLTADRPNLVMSFIQGDRAGGQWSAVDVIARCAASAHERPITVYGRLTVRAGDESEFVDAMKFGLEFTSQEGAFDAVVDAPGGLGGEVAGGRMAMWPIETDVGDRRELRLDVVSPEGEVVAIADVERIERSQGDGGVRIVLREANGVFSIEDRIDLTTRNGRRTIRIGDLSGMPVLAVEPGMNFLRRCRPPCRGRVRERHAPPAAAIVDANLTTQSAALIEYVDKLGEVVDVLVRLQRCAVSTIRLPDLSAVDIGQLSAWKEAAKVLAGDDLIRTYPEGRSIIIAVDDSVVVPSGPFAITIPMIVIVGTQSVNLGHVEVCFDDPIRIDPVPERRNEFIVETKDRKVRYSLPDSPIEGTGAGEVRGRHPGAARPKGGGRDAAADRHSTSRPGP